MLVPQANAQLSGYARNKSKARTSTSSRHRSHSSSVVVEETTSSRTGALGNYANSSREEVAEMRRVEKEKFDAACMDPSREAFEQYLDEYPNGKYVNDVNKRLADFDLWDRTRSAGTLQAYKNYVKTSTYKFFRDEAETEINNIEDKDAFEAAKRTGTIQAYQRYKNNSRSKVYAAQADKEIARLQELEAWNQVSNSRDKYELQNFVNDYPSSSHRSEVEKRIHEIQGADKYELGNLSMAYNEFNAAGGRSALTQENREKYDKCVEYVEFSQLGQSSSEQELTSYLRKYPAGKYRADVSDMIALKKAATLTKYSSNASYDEALSYAVSHETRYRVEQTIASCKKQAQDDYRATYGSPFQVGIQWIDFGVNVKGLDPDYFPTAQAYYNLGIVFRLFNNRKFVNFLVGVQPGAIMSQIDDTEKFEDDYDFKFHMPVFAQIRLNLARFDTGSFFIQGTGYYNAVKKDYLEADMAWGAGLGVNTRHGDYSLYVKKELDAKYDFDCFYVGFSSTYFF